MNVYDEFLKEIYADYEKKLDELKALSQSFRGEMSSKINLRKNDISKAIETKSEVAP